MFSYNFIILFVPAIIEWKYSYVDNDGTPVQVKYFADDKNYGVELQSIKVVEGNEQPAHFVKPAKTNYLASDPSTMLPEPEAQGNVGLDFPPVFPKPEDKYKVPNPMDFLSMKSTPKSHCKEEKPLEYDFARNDLMPLKNKKCGKDRVRLYYDKRSRRVRKNTGAFKDEMPKICDQF
ncbi:uncharacterized protein isoform X2 [Choristoneura fumiferana]|uniref:uncharacterized protein isoform X2 n=1 Tax=Choristoneura fumiferana TaxID=7141 RepID=UPI003D15C775